MPTWTTKDDALARKRGWTLHNTEQGGTRIMRADKYPGGKMWFIDPKSHPLIDLVVGRAMGGDKTAIKAFLCMDQEYARAAFGELGLMALAAEHAPELLRE